MTRNGDSLMSIADLSRLLNVSGRTVRRLAAQGVIPVYRFSRKLVRFEISEVTAALQRVRVAARGEKA